LEFFLGRSIAIEGCVVATHLTANSYGKSRVRLTKVTRTGDRHDLMELSVDVALEGAFEDSYTAGDNTSVVATDSMKNTVYVLAKEHPIEAIESFAATMGEHYLKTYPHVSGATIDIAQAKWARIQAGGNPHTHPFGGGGDEKRTAQAVCTRSGTKITAGIEDLLVLKTTDSAFKGFVRDRYTTLKETDDRIFATSISATWTYAAGAKTDFNKTFDAVRAMILETFAANMSLAVQQTLYEMGEKILASVPSVEEVAIVMPNKHRLLVDLKAFGLENRNEIFVPTDEPYGMIRGVIRRK
jgi:urate oxidase